MSDEPMSAGLPENTWARVEIFGHRCHYGRISEFEVAGAKLLRIDVPIPAEDGAVPGADDGAVEQFETVCYGGAAIFSIAHCSEAHARQANARTHARPTYQLRDHSLHELHREMDDDDS